MNIRLWHNNEVKQWRWTFVDDRLKMHSGQNPKIRDAMNEIATTLEELKGFCDDK